MWRVYVTVRDRSVCLSHQSTAAAACGEFAAVGPAGGRYRSIAARPALSSKCDQCHVVSWRTKLNTDLFTLLLRSSRKAQCYDEHALLFVCLSVCLSVGLTVRACISGTIRLIFAKFSAHVTYSDGSVLWQRCGTLCSPALWMMPALHICI